MSEDRNDGWSIDGDLFVVLVNEEDQHSLWPARLAQPAGWRQVGEPASRAACLEQVEARWTDMRPRSLREAMDGEPG